jgi:hypothetical protein
MTFLSRTIRDVKTGGLNQRCTPRNTIHLLIRKSLSKTEALEQMPKTSRKQRILVRNKPFMIDARFGEFVAKETDRRSIQKIQKQNGKLK